MIPTPPDAFSNYPLSPLLSCDLIYFYSQTDRPKQYKIRLQEPTFYKCPVLTHKNHHVG